MNRNDTDYDDSKTESLVKPPHKIPLFLKLMIKIADIKAGKKMLTGRILAWSSKIGISSGLLEMFIEDGAASSLDERLIKLLRIKISYTVPCPFAIDVNSQNYTDFNITLEELEALQGYKEIETVESFSKKEKTALIYAEQLSKAPITISEKLLSDLKHNFSDKEIVVIAALTAKVNFWARLIEGLRIKPAGYTNDSALKLDEFKTIKK